MKRKVVKLGPSTLVISLPAKWTKETGIVAGKELEIIENSDGLQIQFGEKVKERKEISINITNYSNAAVKNHLTHLYRTGLDKITLQNIKPEKHALVTETTRDLLLGFEVTQKEEKQWTLENIVEPVDQKFETILKRCFFTIKESITLTLNSFKNNEFNIDEIQALRIQHDKFILFCKRILTKRYSNYALNWELLTFLTHIQHAIYYLYKHTEKYKSKTNATLLKYLDELQEYFDYYYNANYSNDMDMIVKINDLRNRYYTQEIPKLIAKGENSIIYAYLREIFRLIQIGMSPILSRLLQENVSEH
jgi:phosphate uptake regulator